MIPVIGSLGIAIGYSVVVGWFLKYLFSSVTGSLLSVTDMGGYFGELATRFGSVGWHMLGLAITFLIMAFGVSRGIEKMNKWMMPAFFVLFLILMVRVFTLDHAGEGYRYLFVPDWSALADVRTWVFALGQAFFSLSLAGSGTIVYGSYLSDDADVVTCARNVAFFDTCAALLAGMVVIPAVFAFGLDVTAGPPLMFITLPAVFNQMPAGWLFAVIFFIAVLFAAITSSIALTESAVSTFEDELGWDRTRSTVLIGAIMVALGQPVGAWATARWPG